MELSTLFSKSKTAGTPSSKRSEIRRVAYRSFRRHWQLYLLIIPPVLYFIIFKYLPMANAVLAFKNYNVVKGIWGSPWVGTQYFEMFFAIRRLRH